MASSAGSACQHGKQRTTRAAQAYVVKELHREGTKVYIECAPTRAKRRSRADTVKVLARSIAPAEGNEDLVAHSSRQTVCSSAGRVHRKNRVEAANASRKSKKHCI